MIVAVCLAFLVVLSALVVSAIMFDLEIHHAQRFFSSDGSVDHKD
jgi:hypothetical protein